VVVLLGQSSPTVDDLEDLFGVDDWTFGDFIWAIAIVVFSFLFARLVRIWVTRILSRFDSINDQVARLIGRALSWFIGMLGVVYALSFIGVEVGPPLMVLLLIGLIVFFAGKGILANFSSGLILQGSSMFGLGDQVITDAGIGTVRSITERTIVIETIDGHEIHIPNRSVVAGAVTNLTRLGRRLSELDMSVAYGTDPSIVRTAVEDALTRCPRVFTDPPAETLIREFGSDAIEFQIRFWHEPDIVESKRAVDEAAEAILTALAGAGITIAFPQRTLWWGDTTDGTQ
jgi:small conductance mechanosensitive channel